MPFRSPDFHHLNDFQSELKSDINNVKVADLMKITTKMNEMVSALRLGMARPKTDNSIGLTN